ncbi:MAG: desulfoferrodoxin [Ruminococcaceae bacterium]|nr:desulfoferrodoxin [Oscillospiraceae bacterium]
MRMKFYKCSHCGNIITFMENKGVPVMCCGQKMDEIIPGSVDAAAEKHVPVISVDGDCVTVTVGDVAHPMTEEHHIAWVVLETENGFQKAELNPTGTPAVKFALAGDKAVAAYAYCNLHGLWKAEV